MMGAKEKHLGWATQRRSSLPPKGIETRKREASEHRHRSVVRTACTTGSHSTVRVFVWAVATTRKASKAIVASFRSD